MKTWWLLGLKLLMYSSTVSLLRVHGVGCKDVDVVLFDGRLHQPLLHVFLEKPQSPFEFPPNQLRKMLELGLVEESVAPGTEWLST